MSTSETMMYEWNRVDWCKLERGVFKLQKRIFRASRWGMDDNHHLAEEPDEGKLSRPVLKTSSSRETRT
jgi:hypothetical protein